MIMFMVMIFHGFSFDTIYTMYQSGCGYSYGFLLGKIWSIYQSSWEDIAREWYAGLGAGVDGDEIEKPAPHLGFTKSF